MTDVMSDGVNMRFRGLPAAGTYWDYGGSSTPAWVNGCTVPPWLYCNGTTFSSATYPALTDIIGGTTLPDFRGRTSIQLNDGTNRTSSGGIDGNTLFASGGNQSFALSQANLPNTTFPVTDFGHTHTATTDANTGTAAVHQFISGGAPIGANVPATISLNPAFSGVRVFSGGSGAQVGLVPPTTFTGIRMVRAA
jgi:microcystin-dependent protein